MRMKGMLRRWAPYSMAIALVALFAAGALAAEPEGAPEIPPGFVLVTENNLLQLYLHPELTQFVVVDKRNAKVWRTNPPGPYDHIASPLWRSHAQSQIVFTYTDARRRQMKETDPISEAASVSYEPILDGVRVVYNIRSRGIILALDYTLGRDYLEVRIPDSELKENSEYKIVHIELLPFFGTATDQDEGYMVFPDSSGAIAPFTSDHGRYVQQFEEYVYGPEDYPFVEYVPLIPVARQVPMPIFGMKHEDGAFLGVITEGEFDARVVAAPSGYIVNYYRTNAKFVVRREFVARLSQTTNVQSFEEQRIRTDRAVRYYLLPEEQASYAGMALRYREHLVDTLRLQPGRVAGEDGVAPLHLRIFHGVLEDRLIFDNLIVMTTFDEARRMVERLMESGVKELDVTLVGWTKGGYAGRYPRRLPVESAFGGARGLRAFAEWAKERGVRVYLEDNYIDAYLDNGGFWARRDVVRDPSRLPIRGFSPGYRSDRYILSAGIALDRYARRDIPQLAGLGVTGIEFERFGWTLLSDRNRNFTAEREQVADAWINILELANEEVGSTIVQGGNVYLLPHVDKVMRAPMEKTTHLFAKRSIPFYQIAVHGLVPYYGWPGNLRSEPVEEYLKSVEYGALPVFELTHRSSSLLKEARRYNILYSSEFDLWFDTVLNEYREQSERMGYLQDLAIVDHHEVDDRVFVTVYEDGSKVYVNYRNTAWRQGDLTVPPLDYLLVGGGVND